LFWPSYLLPRSFHSAIFDIFQPLQLRLQLAEPPEALKLRLGDRRHGHVYIQVMMWYSLVQETEKGRNVFITAYRDRNGDLWVEYPEGSGLLARIDEQVAARVAEKFGADTIVEVEKANGPLTRLRGPQS
jgi:hypothetical protein